jgi:hypothetical protein
MQALIPPVPGTMPAHRFVTAENVGTMIPAGTVERGERKRTVDEVSKAD